MLRVLLIGFATALLLLGAGMATAYWVVGTPGGTSWALLRALPDDVTVAHVEGRLLGPLTLHGIEHRSEAGRVRVERLHLEWVPRSLTRREVEVSLLDVAGVTFVQSEDPPEAEEGPIELPEVEIPVSVTAERIRVSELRLVSPAGEEQLIANEIVASGLTWNGVVSVAELRFEAEGYRALLAGTVVPTGDYPLELRTEWEVSLPDLPRMVGEGHVTGSLEVLSIEQSLSAPTRAEARIRVLSALSEPTWEAQVHMPRFALGELDELLEPYEAGVELQASGDSESAAGRAEVVGSVEEVGEVAGAVEASFAGDELRIAALELRLPATGGALTAEGTATFGGEHPTFDITGRWTGLGWPVEGDAFLTSPEGHFAVSGTVEAYDVEVDAVLAGEDLPRGRWTMAGRGTPASIDLRTVGEVVGGRIEADGALAWDPDPEWNLRIAGEGLDPAAYDPEMPAGSFDFALLTEGGVRGEVVSADVRLDRLEGRIEDVQVAADGKLGISGERIEIRSLAARSGSVRMAAQGSVEESWDLSWEVDAPDLAELSSLVDGLEGSFQASGELLGERERPHVIGELVGDSLALGELGARHVTGFVDVDLSDRRPSSLRFVGEDLEAPGARALEVRVEGEGTIAEHALSFFARGVEERTAEAGFRGGFEEESWRGSLERAMLTLPLGEGSWTLMAPAQLHLAAERVELGRACLEGTGRENLCIEGTWDEEAGGSGRMSARDFPLSLASPWIPGIEVEGELEMEAVASVDPEGVVLAEGEMTGTPGLLRYTVEPGEVEERAYDGFLVRFEADAESIATGFALHFTETQGLDGELRIALAEAFEDWEMSGRVAGSVEDEGLAGALFPDFAPTGGTLRVDLSPGGTFGAPLVRGSVFIEDATGALAAAGVQLEGIGLALTSDDGAAWSLTGTALSGPGSVELEGRLVLPEGESDWSGEVAVRGERFEVFNTPLARVLASPDLTTSFSPDRIDVRGSTVLPEARITPRDLEGTVLRSPDVVIVRGEEEAPEEPAPIAALYAQVAVTMGDEVLLDAFGLTGRLAGSITVDAAPGRPIRGRGELQIVEGQYTMYRQTLQIERGRLIFADGPIEDPGLDIRVTRSARDVLVGMDVSGTATEPSAVLFSEPSMAEADILSYLAIGRPASLAGEEDGEMLGRAAEAVGMAGAQRITDRVGRGFLGLDEARLETAEGQGLQEAQLVVGTYLSPRLYVGYGLGLFHTTNVLRLRYQLGEDWLLRTESGVETGADLLYSRER